MSIDYDPVEIYRDDEELHDPEGSNDLLSRDFFIERSLYKEGSYPDAFVPSPMDLWQKSRYLYGRLDLKGYAIYPKESMLKEISLPDEEEPHYLVDFVADAFQDFRKEYVNYLVMGRIESESAFEEFVPTRSWSSATAEYTAYINTVMDVFVFDFLKQNSYFPGTTYMDTEDIADFHDFFKAFMRYANLTSHQYPITLCTFVKSINCSPLSSGLMIELSDDLHSEDNVKFNKFLMDDNFPFYANFAQKFGFKVDKNAPWRLIADLRSPVMEKRMAEKNIKNLTQFFNKYYNKAYTSDIDLLKSLLFESYREFVSSSPSYNRVQTEIDCGNYSAITKKQRIWATKINREILALGALEKKYSELFWFENYIRLRFLDMGHKNIESKTKSIMRQVEQLKKTLDKKAKLVYINRRILACTQMRRVGKSPSGPMGGSSY